MLFPIEKSHSLGLRSKLIMLPQTVRFEDHRFQPPQPPDVIRLDHTEQQNSKIPIFIWPAF